MSGAIDLGRDDDATWWHQQDLERQQYEVENGYSIQACGKARSEGARRLDGSSRLWEELYDVAACNVVGWAEWADCGRRY